MKRVLVTGGAGYIGSHVVLALLEANYDPIVLDNLSTGVAEAVPQGAPLRVGDVGDAAVVTEILRQGDIDAVMHLAGSILLAESIADPIKYYANNTVSTLTLLRCCLEENVSKFIFSSSASVYGTPAKIPVDESEPTGPKSPYGASKLFSERMLLDASVAFPGFAPVCLRYFNVAGADPQGRTGPRGTQSADLIGAAIETALGQRERLEIFGADYDTRDGTCERDYIHVTDLAEAHLAALRYLERGGGPSVMNCGYGTGYTVLEVIAAVEACTGEKLPTRPGPRRAGDLPRMTADATKIRRSIGWRPAHASLDEIVSSAINWRRAKMLSPPTAR